MMPPAIKQMAQSCADVAAQLVEQREFFEFHRKDMPPAETILPLEPRYSGTRSNDELTNLRVGAMRLLGMSDRAIERECAIDRRTIPHRLKWLEQAGRLPAQKDRIVNVVGEAAEKSGLLLNSLLDRGAAGEVDTDLAAMIRSVATTFGIAVEKLQLVTGGPTEIVQVVAGSPRAEIEAWLKENCIEVNAGESPSSAAGLERQQLKGFGGARDLNVAGDGLGTLLLSPGRGGSPAPGATEMVDGSNGFQNSVPWAVPALELPFDCGDKCEFCLAA